MKFWGIRSTLTKNHKNKKIGQPENYTGRIRSNLNLEVILEIKNPKNVKSRKTAKLFLAIFGKIFGHKRLKLHRIFSHYDLKFCFYIKIFVGGCLNNNRKMSTNITRRTTRTSQSSPRPIFEARLCKRQSKKRLAGVSSLSIFITSLSSRLSMPNPSQTAWILRHWWRHLPELHLPDELCTTWRAPSLPWHVPLQRKNDHRCAHLKMCFAHDRFCWSLKTFFFCLCGHWPSPEIVLDNVQTSIVPHIPYTQASRRGEERAAANPWLISCSTPCTTGWRMGATMI